MTVTFTSRLSAAAAPLKHAWEHTSRLGDFLGNLPQAFSHLGLIAAVLDLQQAKAPPGFAGRPDHEKFQRGVGHTTASAVCSPGYRARPKPFACCFPIVPTG